MSDSSMYFDRIALFEVHHHQAHASLEHRFSLTKVSEYMDVYLYPAKYDSFAISLYRDLSS